MCKIYSLQYSVHVFMSIGRTIHQFGAFERSPTTGHVRYRVCLKFGYPHSIPRFIMGSIQNGQKSS